MSVEETQQPSFTVTAGALPQPSSRNVTGDSEKSTRAPSPSSYSSVANRYETDPGFKETYVEPEDEGGGQTESLRQWTLSQRKANEDSGDHTSAPIVDEQNRAMPNIDVAEVPSSRTDQEGSTPELEVPDPTADDLDNDALGDNVSTPDDSATHTYEVEAHDKQEDPLTPKRSRVLHDNPANIAHGDQPGLLPVNEFSPFKHKQATTPSIAKMHIGVGMRRSQHANEQDSFAEDDFRPHIRPADQVARMLQPNPLDTSEVQSTSGRLADELLSWNNTAMQAQATLPISQSGAGPTSGEEEQKNGPTAFALSSDQSEASQSVPQVEHEEPDESTPSPTRMYLNLSSNPEETSPIQSRRFGRLNESQSSQGMPGEAPFSQYEMDESQHSLHSMEPIATQSVPRAPPPRSSPPLEQETGPSAANRMVDIETHPQHSMPQGETNISSGRPQSTYSVKGTTQEPTQLVTDDELIAPIVPARTATPPIPARRALPSARKWRDGNGVVSLPTEMPTDFIPPARDASTIAAPQAVQVLAQSTMGPPPALEDAYHDAAHVTAEPDVHEALIGTDASDVNMPPQPTRPSSPQTVRPHSSPSVTLTTSLEASAPTKSPAAEQCEELLEPTFVDPTLTSLPSVQPARRTPRQYGKQNAVNPPSPVSPTPQEPSPHTRSAEHNIDEAETDQSENVSEATAPAPRPLTTKSGRVPKRKRRDSSASMSGSGSSSEELDPYDESYRPASRTGSKGKGRAKVVNPSVKRLKGGSNSASSSRTASNSSRLADGAEVSTPLTPPPTSSPPNRSPFVFAYWHPNWHVGQVKGMDDKGRYHIAYEDESIAYVAQNKVRRGVLRVGDKVREVGGRGSKDLVVSEAWQGETAKVKVEGSRAIPIKYLYIRKAVVATDFEDRVLTPADLGFDVKPLGSPQPTNRPQPTAPAQPVKHVSETFAGKIFFITSTRSGNDKVRTHQNEVCDTIRSHGGKIVSSWDELFDLPASEFGSTLASTSAPFLLQETDQSALTAKVLVSLAKGIPCLSVSYVNDAISDSSVDWRSYLVESGFSEKFNQHCSQVIDGSWGKKGWNAATAEAERRPFLGKTFLFLEPSGKYKFLKKLLLVCLHAMGAAAVEVVNRLGNRDDANKYDYVLVEDRAERKQLPGWLKSLDHACNVAWLKQCLIIGAALKPAIYENK